MAAVLIIDALASCLLAVPANWVMLISRKKEGQHDSNNFTSTYVTRKLERCSVLSTDCDGAADEMPELSDGDDDGDDEEQWQWMEEGDSQQVTCLFCDR